MVRTLLPFMVVLPALVYSLISLWCALRFFRPRQPVSGFAPAVTILKPVKGMDGDSYDNFASFCCQEYAGEQEIIFSVASADDPVIPVIHQLIDDFVNHTITLVINPAEQGPNRKISNLINAWSHARHGIIVICDSDVFVPADYLSSITGHFSDPRVGMATSLYRTSDVHGIATAVEATGFTAEMIPNVLVARHLEGLSFGLGASMAVRREALLAVGGFEALARFLADDYQLGNRIHRAGWQVVLDRCLVESVIQPENLMTVLSRQLRWARTMRVSRPFGYLASGLILPFPALLLASLVAPSPVEAILAVALLYGVRFGVCTLFSRRFVQDNLFPRWLWLLPLRDMLAFCTWALSFLGNRVMWRGSRYLLKPGGTIEELV